MSEHVKLSELTLGDKVKLFDGPYGFATVRQVKDGEVTFFRPYVATGDFSYTGGVICTIGIEEFKTNRTDQKWEVIERGNVEDRFSKAKALVQENRDYVLRFHNGFPVVWCSSSDHEVEF